MKSKTNDQTKLWLATFPIIFLFCLIQVTADLGESGQLNSRFLRETIYPLSRTVNGIWTNLKFRIRGSEPVKQKIVILAADDASIQTLGRWPWNREIYASVIHYALKKKAKIIGLDLVLSEPENRVPLEAIEQLQAAKVKPELIEMLQSLNTDQTFAETVGAYSDRVVLGYAPSGVCQPRYDSRALDQCPVDHTESSDLIHSELDQFALTQLIPLPIETIFTSPLNTILTAVTNIPLFSTAAKHAGAFYVAPDPDGYIRRYPLVFINRDRIYPSLALAMARALHLREGKTEPSIQFTDDARIQSFQVENKKVPTTPLGYLDLNFHAAVEKDNYPMISIADFLAANVQGDAKYDSLIEDSILFFGVTALGVFDMRAFPFNSNSPGVEGHATALDNLLTGDALRSASSLGLGWLPIFLMIVLGLGFGFLFIRMESIPSIGIFFLFILCAGWVDIVILFQRQINFSSALLLLEIVTLFGIILSFRFIWEEKNKKFVKQAFSHYLAPQVVDYVLKDPSKLAIGGERKELSVLFTDIRGFTTLSEKMEPKELSQFLNEYLTAMTDVIFEFGGTLDKYIGDAVMAFWGAPVHRDDHAYQAALACLKMQEKMGELQAHFRKKYGAELSMGVGLNSGIVSVGNMGSKKIFDYTVIGDHVNLASRLEGLNRFYGTGVLCSHFTLECMPESARRKLHYRRLDSVKVKGKKLPIEIIELCSAPIHEPSYELFCLARENFRHRRWPEAKAQFQKSADQYLAHYRVADPVCAVFMDRCDQFESQPPPENWDGAIEMREK